MNLIHCYLKCVKLTMRKMGKKKKRNRETGGSERGKELAERGRLVGWLVG